MMRFTGKTDGVPSGTILMWSGAIVDIPAGFNICDGNNGTPDLRDNFVVGAGSGHIVGHTGGTLYHSHSGDTAHQHNMIALGYIAAGVDYENFTDVPYGVGVTGDSGTLPPYYALAYIMKS